MMYLFIIQSTYWTTLIGSAPFVGVTSQSTTPRNVTIHVGRKSEKNGNPIPVVHEVNILLTVDNFKLVLLSPTRTCFQSRTAASRTKFIHRIATENTSKAEVHWYKKTLGISQRQMPY